MARQTVKTLRTGAPALVGLVGTAVIVACHWAGLDRRAELMALDWRFRHLGSTPANPDLLIVKIDDPSLERVGRWPWPREILAGLVETLYDCGARAVALDIILPDPQPTRYESPATDVYDPDMAPVVGAAGPQAVFDDARFEDVLRRTTVFLPMHVDFGAARASDGSELEARVGEMVRRDPRRDFAAVLADVLPDAQQGLRTHELDLAAGAYWRQRALLSLRRFALPAEQVGGFPAGEGVVVPPLVRFADLCSGTGFVTFRPDSADGVMRRIPLLARCGRDVYPQFAFRLAAGLLAGGGPFTLHAGPSRVRLEARAPASAAAPGAAIRAIPVDSEGAMLINWRTDRPTFRDIPAAAVAFIWQLRKDMETNHRLARLVGLELAERLGQEDLKKLYAEADALHRQRVECQVARQRAVLYAPAEVPPVPPELLAAVGHVEREIDRLTGEMLANLGFLAGALPAGDPQRQAVEGLAARHAAALRANRDRSDDVADELAQLRRLVEGRTCLVGSTATGAADFVPTPVAPQMPGVEVHANILNTVVAGAFVTEAPGWANLAAVALAGVVVALLAAHLPVLQAAPLAALLAAGYAAANFWGAFAALHRWLAVVAPVAAMLAAFLAVTAYRQFTEERAKRHIRSLFAHALSPVLVDQILADPSQLNPTRRTLTCFFSDLTSFTPLAERLGEQGTVAVLRRYFDRTTDVIQNRRGGYLNKFLGDGVVGFFGAPVVQEDHARRALKAATECLQEVRQLNLQLAEQFGGRVDLSCRIGISTGSVMFGNCGSTDRSDYTAIGGCVNLASRLESANKQFGTRILADERAWREGGGEWVLARPLGRVLVVGKAEPVSVWHLVCPSEAASPELRAAAAEFARAVELFAERRFEEAARLFESQWRRWPDDKAAELYLSLCRQYLLSPPPTTWDGAVRLTEK